MDKGNNIKFRPGRMSSEFSPVPTLLSVKTFKKYNILIGDDLSQQRFAEQIFEIPCVYMEGITDQDIQVNNSPKLFRVETARLIVLSPQVSDMVSYWSLDPIEKGSAGANAIVRYAATLLSMGKPDKSLIERTADVLATEGMMNDIRVSLWTAVWLLTGSTPQEGGKRWPQPWEQPLLWFSVPGVSPEYRLNSLYLDLTAYTFLQGDEDYVLKKAGLNRVSSAKMKVLKKLILDYHKVYDTIKILDLWRSKHTDPYICAFRISSIWGLHF